jgi:hypothetical protein
MTCIGAHTFYGVQLSTNYRDSILQFLFVILYKVLNNIPLDTKEQEFYDVVNPDDEEEEEDDFESRLNAFDSLTCDYEIWATAQQSLGFSVCGSMGNTWNGNGFAGITIFGGPANECEDGATPIDLALLQQLAQSVTQQVKDNVKRYLELLRDPSANTEPRWLLYASA